MGSEKGVTEYQENKLCVFCMYIRVKGKWRAILDFGRKQKHEEELERRWRWELGIEKRERERERRMREK